MKLEKRRRNPVRADHARCPVTGKLRYKSQTAADNALKQIILTGGMGQQAFRTYPCEHAECGGWHTTSKPRLRPY